MSRLAPLPLFALCIFSACVTEMDSADKADPRDATFSSKSDSLVIADGSSEALACLYVANTATFEELDDDVPLDRRAAAGIISHRTGLDGVDGTADDDRFDDLNELDAVPYVGPAALAAILEYARTHPSSSTYDAGRPATTDAGSATPDASSSASSDSSAPSSAPSRVSVFDSARCSGSGTTVSVGTIGAKLIPAGASVSRPLPFDTYFRRRACNAVSGCAEWSAFESGRISMPVRSVDFVNVRSNSNDFLSVSLESLEGNLYVRPSGTTALSFEFSVPTVMTGSAPSYFITKTNYKAPWSDSLSYSGRGAFDVNATFRRSTTHSSNPIKSWHAGDRSVGETAVTDHCVRLVIPESSFTSADQSTWVEGELVVLAEY